MYTIQHPTLAALRGGVSLGKDPDIEEPPERGPTWVLVVGIGAVLSAFVLLVVAGASGRRSVSLGNGRERMLKRHGYDITTGAGQKRLMYESVGIDITRRPKRPLYYQGDEYGHDPITDEHGNPTGKVRMVPSGRIVDLRALSPAERNY